jgi:hypothetical protein
LATSNNLEKLPEFPITFFMDRTHQSKVTAKLLRDLGVPLELHKRHFLPDTPDPDWIKDCANNGWLIISGDKGIEYDGINRFAVAESRAKVFLLADTCARGAEWAASLVMARHKISRLAATNNGPFYCSIEMGNDKHVDKVRCFDGGGPIEKPSIPEFTIAVPDVDVQAPVSNSPDSYGQGNLELKLD